MKRIHVDWTRCDGHGSCAELLPELFTQDDWGFPLSRTGEKDPAVPRALLEHADHAVAACPLMALRLYNAPDPARAARPAQTSRSTRSARATVTR